MNCHEKLAAARLIEKLAAARLNRNRLYEAVKAAGDAARLDITNAALKAAHLAAADAHAEACDAVDVALRAFDAA